MASLHVVTTHLLQPLGMHDSFYEWDEGGEGARCQTVFPGTRTVDSAGIPRASHAAPISQL